MLWICSETHQFYFQQFHRDGVQVWGVFIHRIGEYVIWSCSFFGWFCKPSEFQWPVVVCPSERRRPPIILKGEGSRREGHHRCVRIWLTSHIRAWKVLLLWGQEMVADAGGLRALFFLSCLRFSAAALYSDSYWRAPACTAAHQLALSEAAYSHDDGSMPKALKEPLSVFLKYFFWPLRDRLLSWSSPNRSFLGSLWSGMRATLPAQRSWSFIKMVVIFGSPSTSVDFCVWYPFLPTYAKYFPKSGGMEVVQLTGMTLIYSPCLTIHKAGWWVRQLCRPEWPKNVATNAAGMIWSTYRQINCWQWSIVLYEARDA